MNRSSLEKRCGWLRLVVLRFGVCSPRYRARYRWLPDQLSVRLGLPRRTTCSGQRRSYRVGKTHWLAYAAGAIRATIQCIPVTSKNLRSCTTHSLWSLCRVFASFSEASWHTVARCSSASMCGADDNSAMMSVCTHLLFRCLLCCFAFAPPLAFIKSFFFPPVCLTPSP